MYWHCYWTHSLQAPHHVGDHSLAMAEPRYGVDTTCRHCWSVEHFSLLVPHKATSGYRQSSLTNSKSLCNQGPWGLLAGSAVTHCSGSAFFPAQPGILSFHPGICHFAAARSSTSCSLFPVGTWLQVVLSMLFTAQEGILFPQPAAHKRKENREAEQEFFPVWGIFLFFLQWGKGLAYSNCFFFLKLCLMKLIL